MREIKFRGKTIDGEWVHGLLSISQGLSGQPAKGCYISNSGGMPWAYQIRPETIGLFVGLQDKNGKDIYEGDLIRVLERDWGSMCLTDFKGTIDEYMICISAISEVVYEDGSFKLIQRKKGNYHSKYVGDNYRRDIFEIIGNIHENPELLCPTK